MRRASIGDLLSTEKLLERVQEINAPAVTRIRTNSSDQTPQPPGGPNSPRTSTSPTRRAPTRTLSGQAPRSRRGGPRKTTPSCDDGSDGDLIDSSDDEPLQQQQQQSSSSRRRTPQRTRSAVEGVSYQRSRTATDRPPRQRRGDEETAAAASTRRRIQRSKSSDAPTSGIGQPRVPRAGRRRPGRGVEDDYDDESDEEEVVDMEDEEVVPTSRKKMPNRTRSANTTIPRRGGGGSGGRTTAQNLQSRQIAQMTTIGSKNSSDKDRKGIRSGGGGGTRMPQRTRSMDLTTPTLASGRAAITRGTDRRAMREERMQARLEKQRQQLQQQVEKEQKQQQLEAAEENKPEPAWKRRLKLKAMDESIDVHDLSVGSDATPGSGGSSARLASSLPIDFSRRQGSLDESFDNMAESSPGFVANFDDNHDYSNSVEDDGSRGLDGSRGMDESMQDPFADPMGSSMPGRIRRVKRPSKKLDAFHASLPRNSAQEEDEDSDAAINW